MIQIVSREQFARAEERARKERQRVRRYERNVVEVHNTAHGTTYLVRFEKKNGLTFGTCSCEAGTPTHGNNRVPIPCKHLYVAAIFVKATARMRRAH